MSLSPGICYLEAFDAIMQRLAEAALKLDLDDPTYVHSFVSPRISVIDDTATVTYYFRKDNPSSCRLDGLGYGIARFRRDGLTWTMAERDEILTGDERGPARLLEGLSVAARIPQVDPREQGAARVLTLLNRTRVQNLLGSYGMAADSGISSTVVPLYTGDVKMSVDGTIIEGRKQLTELFETPGHLSLMPWSAHTMGPSLILTGDRNAVSIHYGRTHCKLPRPEGLQSFVETPAVGPDDRGLLRYSVNRWEARLEADGEWRVAERLSRSPNTDDMRKLLAEAVGWSGSGSEQRTGISRLDNLIDRAALADLVVGFGMALDAHVPLTKFFEDSACVTIDGASVPIGEIASALSTGQDGVPVGHVVSSPVIQIAGETASIVSTIYLYSAAASGTVELHAIRYARWRARYSGNGGWRLAALDLLAANSPAARAVLVEALGHRQGGSSS